MLHNSTTSKQKRSIRRSISDKLHSKTRKALTLEELENKYLFPKDSGHAQRIK